MCLEVIFKIGKPVIVQCVCVCVSVLDKLCVYVQVSQYVNSLFFSTLPQAFFFLHSSYYIVLHPTSGLLPLFCLILSSTTTYLSHYSSLLLCGFSFFHLQSRLVFGQPALPSRRLHFRSLAFSITLSRAPGEVGTPGKPSCRSAAGLVEIRPGCISNIAEHYTSAFMSATSLQTVLMK